MSDQSQPRENKETHCTTISRRQALGVTGAASFAGLADAPASGSEGNGGDGTQATADVGVLPNPNFITNARGEAPPFADDTPLFDPGPASIPLNEILEADEEYDSELGRPLNDGKHQVVGPPKGYDRDEGYDEPWDRTTRSLRRPRTRSSAFTTSAGSSGTTARRRTSSPSTGRARVASTRSTRAENCLASRVSTHSKATTSPTRSKTAPCRSSVRPKTTSRAPRN